jgi:hypothetical protein
MTAILGNCILDDAIQPYGCIGFDAWEHVAVPIKRQINQHGGGSRVERVNAAVAELASEYPNAAALQLGLGREWLLVQQE